MNGLQTEFDFVLPKGYIDSSGTLHRRGTMRLATARDEMDPLHDPRVQDANDPYLTIIVLSRVVKQLGTLSQVTPADIENLFAADLAFLQDLYGIINFGSADELQALQASFEPPPPAATESSGDELASAAGSADADDEPSRPRRALVEEVRAGEG